MMDYAGPSLDGVKVLLLDDESDALELIQEILEERHATVTLARNVVAALASLQAGPFEVLLSDIGMPQRDGFEFIAEVRKRGLQTTAAAVTAFAPPRGSHSRADGGLPSPSDQAAGGLGALGYRGAASIG